MRRVPGAGKEARRVGSEKNKYIEDKNIGIGKGESGEVLRGKGNARMTNATDNKYFYSEGLARGVVNRKKSKA